MSSKLFNQSGQTLLEIIVVIAVGVIVVGSLVFATIVSLRNAQFSKNQSEATKLAQEGIEKVRSGRNRNASIVGLFEQPISWDDPRLWGATAIKDSCNPDCYFVLGNNNGQLDWIGSTPPDKPLPNCPPAECLDVNVFKRVVILADDGSSVSSKKVTVIVAWNDFAGSHQSKLTTILRKL